LKNTLVLGGSRSGKSSFALRSGERFLKNFSMKDAKGLYIATAQPLDPEMKDRIIKHKRERGPLWETVEEPLDVPGIINRRADSVGVILVDCMTLWLTNILGSAKEQMDNMTNSLCRVVSESKTPVILVSNELGLGLVPPTPLGREFRDYAGLLNQRLAQTCDRVIMVIAGIPMAIKGEIESWEMN